MVFIETRTLGSEMQFAPFIIMLAADGATTTTITTDQMTTETLQVEEESGGYSWGMEDVQDMNEDRVVRVKEDFLKYIEKVKENPQTLDYIEYVFAYNKVTDLIRSESLAAGWDEFGPDVSVKDVPKPSQKALEEYNAYIQQQESYRQRRLNKLEAEEKLKDLIRERYKDQIKENPELKNLLEQKDYSPEQMQALRNLVTRRPMPPQRMPQN